MRPAWQKFIPVAAWVVISLRSAVGQTGGVGDPVAQDFHAIPLQSFAAIDISGTTADTANHGVTMVNLDDSNQAAYAFEVGYDNSGIPDDWDTPPHAAELHVYLWNHGIATAQPTLGLTATSGTLPSNSDSLTQGEDSTKEFYDPSILLSSGEVYGGETGIAYNSHDPSKSTQISSNSFSASGSSASVISMSGSFSVDIPEAEAGLGLGVLAASYAGYAGRADYTDSHVPPSDGTFFCDVTYSSGPNGMTVFDPYAQEDGYLDDGYTIQHDVDFTPAAINNNGWVVGTDSNWNIYVWNGTTDKPFAIPQLAAQYAQGNPLFNDLHQVVIGNYIWSGSDTHCACALIKSGSCETLSSLIPQQFQSQVSTINPIALSNANATDGSIRLLFTALYQPDPTGPAAAQPWTTGTFILTLESGTLTDLKQVSYPANVTGNFNILNSNSLLAGLGTITTNGTPSAQKALLLVPAEIVPDYNRDGKIDSGDRGKVTQSNPWHWWINDSHTSGDIASGNDCIPGTGTPNYSDRVINGTEDLVNWFPLSLEIKKLLDLLPSSSFTYELRSSDSSMNIVVPSDSTATFDLSESNTQCYFTSTDTAETLASPGAGVQIVIPLTAGSNSSADLSDDLITRIQSNGYGMILVEGSRATAPGTTSALEIHVISKATNQDVAKVTFPMQLSSVEKMYRWVNLRHVAGQSETRPSDTSEPNNYPDSLTNGKMFIFVHGYNVNERQSRAWCAEVFKRLYQQGSNAMFTGVSWHGDYSQIPTGSPIGGGDSPDYWANVVKAFDTSQELANAVNGLKGSSKIIAAHSLGNLVVSYAIQKQGMHVSSYFLLDAAVAMEAYDSSVIDHTDMENPAWNGYATRLWASDWYKLFGSSDGRSALTWRGLLNNVRNAFNFYSSGEDVLDNTTNGQYNSSLNPFSQTAEHAWITQGLGKATTIQLEGAPINRQGGWGFDLTYYDSGNGTPISPANTTDITNAELEDNPFFYYFHDFALFDADKGGAEAKKFSVWTSTIAYGVPALSFAAGRNSVNTFQAQNYDLENFQNNWPQARLSSSQDVLPDGQGRREHGDAKDIAFPFNYLLYQQWVNLGALK